MHTQTALSVNGASDSEPQVVLSNLRGEAEPVGDTEVASAMVVGPAPAHTVRASRGAIGVGRWHERVVSVPILGPLPDVPTHVVESIVVGFLPPDLMGLEPRVVHEPGDVIRVVGS